MREVSWGIWVRCERPAEDEDALSVMQGAARSWYKDKLGPPV